MLLLQILSGKLPFSEFKNDGAIVCAICVTNKRPPKEPKRSRNGASYTVFWEVAGDLWEKDLDRRLTLEAGHARLAAALQTNVL